MATVIPAAEHTRCDSLVSPNCFAWKTNKYRVTGDAKIRLMVTVDLLSFFLSSLRGVVAIGSEASDGPLRNPECAATNPLTG